MLDGAAGASSTRWPPTTTVRVVVLAGAGKAFCAGHDLKEMRAEPSLGYYAATCSRSAAAMMLTIQRLPRR